MRRPERCHVNRQRTLIQRFGFFQPSLVAKQLREIVETNGDDGMTHALAALVDGQRSLVQRLSLREFSLRSQKFGEIIKVRRHLRVIRP